MVMEHQTKNLKTSTHAAPIESKFDFDSLLHPATAFAHPMDVARDPDLTLNEKRAILSSWASDACAVEAAPELRVNAAGKIVRWDDIMDALRMLDMEAGNRLPPHRAAKWRLRRRWGLGSGGEPDCGARPLFERRHARRSRIPVDGCARLRVGGQRFRASQ
jgi:hypothetical protein